MIGFCNYGTQGAISTVLCAPMIDEDEVGLKEKPEEIRYIKMITLKTLLLLGTADSGYVA